MVEALLLELRALASKQRGSGKIDFGYLACGCEREVADRGKFVQARVAITRFFQSNLYLTQLLVLHLQLYLVYFQFLQ
jgi:hypothetical protein